jgi:hypothetical protein
MNFDEELNIKCNEIDFPKMSKSMKRNMTL